MLGRADYALIGEMIPHGSRVLDLGCGDGALLLWLKEQKSVQARGVEKNRELVQKAIARGVTVYQGDLEESLAEYPPGAFDYVILSQTLQESRRPLAVIEGMLRIGRHAVIAFPNFGHWRVRIAHLFSGRAPKTPLFPHNWYDSPNIHFLTIIDFEELARARDWAIERKVFLSGDRRVELLPNLLAEVAIYLVKRRQ
ncbi:MAG: methionine biosynthesis protein MetW [Bryobacteraceae bacterium]|nr:methionine biosynthesis protein MetW [Bryobacteraceae bacterium]